jgi:predicted secreted protein
MKRMIALLCVAGLLQGLGGCTGLPQIRTLLLDQRDDGTTLAVTYADRLVLLLGANPTTGFDWALTADSAAAVSLVEKKFVPDSLEPTIVTGGGGTDIFVLDIEPNYSSTPVSRTFTLELRQAGSPATDPPADTFSMTLQVSS